MLAMWDDIRTYFRNNKMDALIDMAVEVPNEDEYWRWKRKSKVFIEY